MRINPTARLVARAALALCTLVAGSASGALHRAWADVKASLGGGDHTLLATAEEGEDDDQPRWTTDCLALARSLGVGEPPAATADPDELNEWVDRAVARFSRRNGLMDCARQALEEFEA